MMMKSVKFLAAAAILAAAVSCASIEKMAQMAENVKVTCDPGVLEATNDAIDAVVSVTYPADYFNPKAILEVTPVLVYEGGEAKMKPFIYQGEKVKDNYKVVSSDRPGEGPFQLCSRHGKEPPRAPRRRPQG